MENTPIKFQVHFFANMEDITPSADIIPIFLDIFRDKEFLPNIFQEISSGTMEPKNRLSLTSPNNEWIVSIPKDRIIIQKNLLNFKGKNLGTIDEFTQDSINFFARILKKFPRQGHRISLISSSITDQIPDNKMQKIFGHLFNPPEFYQTNDSVGWKTNLITKIPIKIKEINDDLNIISTLIWLKDNPIQYGIMPFFDLSVFANSVLIEFDINTHQGNTKSRFDIDSIEEYYKSIIAIQKSLLIEWEPYFNVK